jgi:hypothetical protein
MMHSSDEDIELCSIDRFGSIDLVRLSSVRFEIFTVTIKFKCISEKMSKKRIKKPVF